MKLSKTLSFLCFLATTVIYSQVEQLYTKTYSSDANTTAFIELNNTSLEIQKSLDNKIHLDFSIDFYKYSDKQKKEYLERHSINFNKDNNHILINIKKNQSNQFSSVSEFFFKNDSTNFSEKKTTEMIISEVDNYNGISSLVKEFIERSSKTEKEKQNRIEKYNKRSYRWKKATDNFILKIPENLQLTIKVNKSKIDITEEIKNHVTIRAQKSELKIKALSNKKNDIRLNHGLFFIESIQGGIYNLSSVYRNIIGQIKNCEIESEFSKVQIGEIQENVNINDYNSHYVIYNWANIFNIFNFNSEYSKINIHSPTTIYSGEISSNNSKLTLPNTFSKNTELSKNKTKVFTTKIDKSINNTGHMNINMTNGFINIY